MERPAATGYTRADKWLASLSDGRRVFVKTGQDVEREGRLLEELEAPFMPALHGWSPGGEEAVLVLEDLSAAIWPPPYPDDTMPLFDALTGAAALSAPDWLRPIAPHDEESWKAVVADPEPFLELGLCSRAWLERAAPELLAAEQHAEFEGAGLVHFDVWSGNVCFTERGAVLVDWALARRGNPSLDVAFALLSVRAEGGMRPAAMELDDEPAWAAYLSGSFAARAPLPLPTGPSRDRLSKKTSAATSCTRSAGSRRRSSSRSQTGFGAEPRGNLDGMLGIGIALVVLGVVLGIFFPVMFVAAAVGGILVIVFFVGTLRAASEPTGTDEPAPGRDE
jgi:phosphotransferase family enzyme